MLDSIGRWFRNNIPLFAKIERWVWSLPQPWAAIVTAIGHGLLTAISGPLAPVVATLYTRRELRAVRDRGYTAPEYDHVSDVVVPWLVVSGYAYIIGAYLL